MATQRALAELAGPLAGFPKVVRRRRELLRTLRRDFGDPRSEEDPRFSPHLVPAFTTEVLAGEGHQDVTFVGPSLGARTPVNFPWERLDPGRDLVLITLGTVSSGMRFVAECAAAVRDRERTQAVIAYPTGTLVAPGAVVRRSVPQLELLERASAVICHGGHNTVCEALYHGVPLVVAPIRDDQPVIAEQVVGSGAGVRLRFTRATARHIGDALDTVLGEPEYGLRRRGRGGGPAGEAALTGGLARTSATC